MAYIEGLPLEAARDRTLAFDSEERSAQLEAARKADLRKATARAGAATEIVSKLRLQNKSPDRTITFAGGYVRGWALAETLDLLPEDVRVRRGPLGKERNVLSYALSGLLLSTEVTLVSYDAKLPARYANSDVTSSRSDAWGGYSTQLNGNVHEVPVGSVGYHDLMGRSRDIDTALGTYTGSLSIEDIFASFVVSNGLLKED